MRNIFATLIIACALLIGGQSSAQTVAPFIGSGDTVKAVGTKYLTLNVGSPGPLAIYFTYDSVSNGVSSVAYLEASVDNVDFARFPVDTVIISNATVNKLWQVKTNFAAEYIAKYWRIRIRTTTATGQGKIRAKVIK